MTLSTCSKNSTDSLSNMEKAESESKIQAHNASAIPTHTTPDKQEQNSVAQSLPPTTDFSDWDGPDDPDNPHNWPMWQRIYHAIAPAVLGFAVTFGTSVYTPSLNSIVQDFAISRTIALLGLTLYTLGIGFGPLITAPLSEGHGRKIVYLASSPIFILFTLGAGFSTTFTSLVICRFFAGLAGSPVLAVGAGTNADLFPPRQRAVATSMFLSAPFAGPAIGPVVGGFVAQYKTWQWSQWSMIFVTLLAFAIAAPMKETYKPVILRKRAKKAGFNPTQTSNVKNTLMIKTFRPLHMLVTEPTVFFFSIYTSFAFGVLFLFFAAFPLIFQRPPYSFTLSQSGLTFISVGIGVLAGSITCILVDRTLYQKKHRKAIAAGETGVAPEHRLYSAMLGSFGVVSGLFWFGWCAGTGRHWALCLTGAVLFTWGNLCVFTSAALYVVDVYGPLNGASAIAANGASRYTFSAVFPLFTIQMYEALGVGWATSVLGFLALLMLPIPWVFYKWGPGIREKSRYPKMS